MRVLRRIFNIAIWAVFGTFLLLVILTHIPSIQRLIGTQVGGILSAKLGTEVKIGRVDLGFFNRIIIDDVEIPDQHGNQMIKTGRISAKFDITPLTKGRISISSAQLFGLKAYLTKASAEAPANFQFVLDSLASKDTTQHKPINLAIKSLIIRNGNISYDRLDIPRSTTFNTNHLDIHHLSTHIMLNAFTEDSVNLAIKKLSCTDRSGLDIRDLSLSFISNKSQATLSQFSISLPHSMLSIPLLTATYRRTDGKIEPASVAYHGEIAAKVSPADLSFALPSLATLHTPLSLSTTFRGTSTTLRISQCRLATLTHTVMIADGSMSDWDATLRWSGDIQSLHISAGDIADIQTALGNKVKIPEAVTRLGDIHYAGNIGGRGSDIAIDGNLHSAIGSIALKGGRSGNAFNGDIVTRSFDLGRLLDNQHLGHIATSIYIKGTQDRGKLSAITAKGIVSQLEYNGYSYKNISVDAQMANQILKGKASIDDPNAKIAIEGSAKLTQNPSANISARVRDFCPSALKLSNQWGNATFNADIQADAKGHTINDAIGRLTVTNLKMKNQGEEYLLSSLTINAANYQSHRTVQMDSDFGRIDITGRYDYASVVQSLTNIIGHRLPTLPGLPRTSHAIHNDFVINATIGKADWLQRLFNIPLNLRKPLTLRGRVSDPMRQIEMTLNAPQFEYNGNAYERGYMRLTSPGDTLNAYLHLQQGNSHKGTYWNVKAQAAHNRLHTMLSFENNGEHNFAGQIDTEAQFYNNEHGYATAHLDILPSQITVGDSIWSVRPSSVRYYKNHLNINHLAIEHNRQHIIVSGNATASQRDTIKVDLQDVDVSYILNLVNFHSVEFSGKATGYAYLSSLFNTPQAKADLWVRDFRFEDGRMGILSANVQLNHDKEQIDIDATAYDEDNARTDINGYVSPKRNYIDLAIKAHNTRGEFLQSFCGSFMDDIQLKTNGDIRVFGDLKEINLEGQATIDGTVRIKPLNATYTLTQCPIKMVPDEIQLNSDEIRDRNGNIGIVNGSLRHKHLTRLSYDIKVAAQHLLAYDTKSYGNDTFYGTVFATGDCRIRGKSGEVNIDADLTPEKGSFIEYNASSPDAISNQSFIHWADRDSVRLASATTHPASEQADDDVDMSSDIRMNLLINCTPDATLRVLMDKQSGDYIALNGNGAIRATYYNKGDFDMFGTYDVDHGIYKLTIQNILRRDFQFLPGGSIGFGGNAMDAQLNLKAQYAVNGVSLSDLSIGKSFTSNNIRVNCLMNITGTPRAPRVDFGLDLPTISNDAKQMITNLINSEEGMNQQVLYLLAVGRFYSQSNNSAQGDAPQQSRTSLAMQSILSGTLSQQLNSILGSVTKNDNWSFGANISTGDEGWNNAEYEGLLSGRMLNNRLLFNGQFGYRDKANATTSFIGDFDLQYLIYPNGNLAIRVYNQTSDRYFTKNSLNTQGLGLILKKDFNGWRDLLGIHKKKDKATRKRKKQKKQK